VVRKGGRPNDINLLLNNITSMSEIKDDAKSQGSRKSGKLHSAI
jgi:hypothetical protein